jgi:hypothetical protein
MANGSTQRAIGPLLLAVIFLAALGGGVGFSLGKLSSHQRHNTTQDSTDTGGNGQRDNGSGGGNGTGGGGGGGTGGGQNQHKRCPQHTVDQAGDGNLVQLLYLHTNRSEVWICQADDGRLFYQGHSGQPGEDLVEHSNALFLNDVQRENGNGFVATNVEPTSGRTTRYHVTPDRLRKEFINYTPPKQEEVENAVG